MKQLNEMQHGVCMQGLLAAADNLHQQLLSEK